MAGSGSGTKESILETPTYGIALILLAFQVVSILFTVVVRLIRKWLRKHKRLGMLAAVNHSVSELTMLGFVSLCLIALQGSITSICVNPSYFKKDWTVLSSVYGKQDCPCCLQSTSNVQQCLIEYAGCGNVQEPFCNCDGKNSSCVVGTENYVNGNETTPVHAALRRMLASVDVSSAYNCSDAMTVVYSGCPPGKVHAVSLLTLEQVHLLIFTLSIVHVISGFVLYGIALLRVHFEWKRWESMEDVHTERVKQTLKPYFDTLNVTLERRSMSLHRGEGAAPSSLPVDATAPDVCQNDQEEELKHAASCPKIQSKEEEDVEQASHVISEKPDLERHSAPLPAYLRSDSHAQFHSMPSTKSFKDLLLTESTRMKVFFIRTKKSISKMWKFVWGILKCVFLGLLPTLVTKRQYGQLRASFMYTHKMSSSFNFLGHLMKSMEDDLSMLVGLTPIFWVVTIIFWLISGPIGYAVMPAMVLNAAVMIILNAKLVSIICHVTARGVSAVRLSKKVFWFNRPQLLLLPMKFCLFTCSFIYASFIFFVWQFSPGSCPFTDAFYPQWVLPWYTIIIFNSIIFIHLAAVTFPAYSMAVQMGSDLKADMLPRRLAKKLLAAVEDAKLRVREERQRMKRSGSVPEIGGPPNLHRHSASLGETVTKAMAFFVEGKPERQGLEQNIDD